MVQLNLLVVGAILLVLLFDVFLSVDGAVSNVQLITTPPCTFTPSWNGAGTYSTGISLANTVSAASIQANWDSGDGVTLWVNGVKRTPFDSGSPSEAFSLEGGMGFGLPCSSRANLIGWYPLIQGYYQYDFSGQSRHGTVVGGLTGTNDHLNTPGFATTFTGEQAIIVTQSVNKGEVAISV